MKPALTLGASCTFKIIIERKMKKRIGLNCRALVQRCIRSLCVCLVCGGYKTRGTSFWGRLRCRQVGSLNFSKAHSQLRFHPDAKPSCLGMPDGRYSFPQRPVGSEVPGPTGSLEVCLTGPGDRRLLELCPILATKSPLGACLLDRPRV